MPPAKCPAGMVQIAMWSHAPVAGGGDQRRHGARIVHTQASGQQCVCIWCARCGGWASSRAFVLTAPCEGNARRDTKSHARKVLAATSALRHPTTGEELLRPWPIVRETSA